MKIVCISDTHNFHNEIALPEGDLLIHAGDATIQGTVGEAQDFAVWWDGLKFKHKIFVAGNHDWLWQKQPAFADTLVPSLHEKEIEIEGLKIYGASWTPEFGGWAFMLNRGREIASRWKHIPEGIDILITHGPLTAVVMKLMV
jgi:predicted phosphodiesterase